MTTIAVPPTVTTHEVTNQPPPLVDHDVSAEAALLSGLEREGAGWHSGDLHRLGRRAGSAQAQLWADQANRHEPELRTHDRYGHRVDEVDFHPARHALLDVAVSEGLAGAPWVDPRPGSHVARAAGFSVWGQVESGHGCPVSMTYAVVPALRATPALAAVYEPLLTSRAYDPGLRVPTTKRGLLAGMGMTEKQGGSDVRANTTTAAPAGEGTWHLRGHKWFTSAPMCDLFLVLAQAPAGLSCFLVPRVLPDGTRNTFRLQRLKDKLGNRSNASSEPELDGTVAWLVGDEGRGIRTIIEMVAMTWLDCVIGYVEDSGMPRLYREAPLNSVWEGSGNVNALDVLRALAREPASVEAFFAELDRARGADTRLDDAVIALRAGVADHDEVELRARRLVEQMALALQGSLLVRHAPAAVADAFCASSLAGDWGHAFGTLPKGIDTVAVLQRALPQ